MAQVVVRVLASADPSLRNVFDNFRSLAKRAGDAVKRDGDTTTKQRAKGYEADARAFEKAEARKTKAALAETRKQTKAVESEQKRQTAIATREEKTRVREAEKQHKTFVREVGQGYNRITTVAGNAFGNMTKIAKVAAGVVTGFAGAIGIETSVGAINQKGMSFEKSIVDVTNSGTKGVASKQDIGRTKSAVEGASDATKTDQNAMADALGKYVGLTGDLDSGISSLEMFGKLARATGADVGDLAGAAGQIANGLGDVPNKAALVAEALRIVAEQGRLGSVEIKDLAQYMGKFASKAQFFEGTRQDAMASLGALAQISMKGGRSTGAEAATSAGNFNGEITSKAADKAFAKYKVERFGKGGRLRDAGEIVLDAIKATKGDGRKLQEMFSQKASRAAATGLAGTYNAAGGGAAGEAAARAELNKYRGSVSEADVEGRAQNSMNTGEARATDLNNRIQRKVSTLIEGLMPAFEKMLPALGELGDSLIKMAPAAADFAKFLVEHPGVAIAGALVGSIVKAGIGEALKGSLLNLVNGVKPGGAGGPGGGGAGGTLAGGLAIAAGLYVVGRAIIDSDLGKQNQAGEDRRATEFSTGDDRVNAFNADAKVRKEARDSLKNNIASLDQKIKLGEEYRTGSSFFRSATGVNRFAGWANDVNPEWGQSTDSQAVGKDASEHLGDLWLERKKAGFDLRNSERLDEGGQKGGGVAGVKASVDASTQLLQSLLGAISGGLNVNVTNMPAGGFDSGGPGRVPGGPT